MWRRFLLRANPRTTPTLNPKSFLLGTVLLLIALAFANPLIRALKTKGAISDFMIETLDSPFTLSEHRGKTVILFFSTPDCTTCAQEIAALERLHTEFSQEKLVIVAINLMPEIPLKIWQHHLKKNGLENAIIGVDIQYAAVDAAHVRTAHSTIILNEKGVEIYRNDRASSYQALKQALAKPR